eukprot:TRINITY_DN5530_c0_g1_i3.p1 TRINITY_DN5530_c0_g1~~TRINITY_DN5530_c0_g1_i3.p1  ORF type:complete len:335 (+),score=78.57 TRINITY_DN5530_c0_g1_i3:339-1343(+)
MSFGSAPFVPSKGSNRIAAYALPRAIGPLSSEPPAELRDLAYKMKGPDGVELKDRTWYLSTYKNCFVGSEAVAWLSKELKVDAEAATAHGQELMNAGYFKHVVDIDKPLLNGYYFYRFHPVPTFDEIIEQVNDQWVESMIDLMDLEEKDPEWVKTKEKNTTKVFTRNVSGRKLKAVKVVTTTEASVSNLLELLHYKMIERHKEWNETFAEGKIVVQVTNDINIQMWKYQLKGPKDRDFLVVRRVVKGSDGAFYIMEKSIKHGLAPPSKDYIRCGLDYNIRYFKQLEDSGGCSFVYINYTDLKGWIPDWLTNAANQDVSVEEIEHIKACAKESNH